MQTASHYRHFLALIVGLHSLISMEDSALQWMQATCEYDTQQLCPVCFQTVPPEDGCMLGNGLSFLEFALVNQVNRRFGAHETLIGIYGHNANRTVVIVKNGNRHRTLEQLRETMCASFALPDGDGDCHWESSAKVLQFLRTAALEEHRYGGCSVCPKFDSERSLERLLTLFPDTVHQLHKLFGVLLNVQPLLLEVLRLHEFPVPRLIARLGFTFVQTYEGAPLQDYYGSPFAVRLRIARQMILAVEKFTTGVHGFRFYLTDINPDNVAVTIAANGEPKVTFVDIDSVIVLDTNASVIGGGDLPPHWFESHTHAKIECDGCFAYVQDDLCQHHYSDINLFSVCQLLLEDIYGTGASGLLHYTASELPSDHQGPTTQLTDLLRECVYCRPSDCRPRAIILQDVLQTIATLLGS